MLIAFDLDDVLVDFTASFFRWHNRRYDTELTNEDLASARYLYEAWGGRPEEAIDRMGLFFAEEDILGLPPLAGAASCLEELATRHRLAVVSARDPRFSEITEQWVESNFGGTFDEVILGIGHSERGERDVTKVQVCARIGASAMLDDQLGHLTGAAEAGIRPLLFGSYPWNRAATLPSGITRVDDWPAVCAAFG